MKLSNKYVNKILSIICKIYEIVNWIFAGLAVLLIIYSTLNYEFVEHILTDGYAELIFKTPTIAALYDNISGEINMFSVYINYIYAVIEAILKALVFRNVDLILATMSKEHNDTENYSPFQKSVVKRVKTIGILFIASPVLDLVVDIILHFSSDIHPRITGDMYALTLGLVCLCLAHIFSYGAKLEDEVDGLL